MSFTYDYESRATSVTGPGMLQTNVYNGLDTRVGSTTNSVANTYLRDGAYVTDAVLKDSTATFTPGVSERRGSTTTFSHSGLKNADAQTGVSQAVNATQQYDAFGNLASSSGTWQGQFGYGGGFGYQQDATGLKLLGHRYYDSSTGRFLTRDPIKDGRNWYVYCESDPIGKYDSGGLVPEWLKNGWNKSVEVINDLFGGVKRVLAIVTVIPSVVIFGLAWQNAALELKLDAEYRARLESPENRLDPEDTVALQKANAVPISVPLKIIQTFWQLIIDAFS